MNPVDILGRSIHSRVGSAKALWQKCEAWRQSAVTLLLLTPAKSILGGLFTKAGFLQVLKKPGSA